MEIEKPEGMLEQPPNNQQTTPASGLSTQSVAQPAENVKKLNLPKGTIVDVSIVGDNSNIIQVKFNGEQGKGKKASRFQDIVKRRKNAMSLLICRVMSCWG